MNQASNGIWNVVDKVSHTKIYPTIVITAAFSKPGYPAMESDQAQSHEEVVRGQDVLY